MGLLVDFYCLGIHTEKNTLKRYVYLNMFPLHYVMFYLNCMLKRVRQITCWCNKIIMITLSFEMDFRTLQTAHHVVWLNFRRREIIFNFFRHNNVRIVNEQIHKITHKQLFIILNAVSFFFVSPCLRGISLFL